MNPAATLDGFLGGRLKIRQSAEGYRAGIDAVFVAAAVPARTGERVLELGSGAGVAGLCLAARVQNISVLGIEQNADLVALANDNARVNDLSARVSFVQGDALAYAPAQNFGHVFMNPPFNDEARGTPAPRADKAKALAAGQTALALWIARAIAMTEHGGSVTMILRADRRDEALTAFADGLGAIVVFPLWPQTGKPAKRVILQGRKGSRAPLVISPGLTLHAPPQKYTDEAEAILRHGQALTLA